MTLQDMLKRRQAELAAARRRRESAEAEITAARAMLTDDASLADIDRAEDRVRRATAALDQADHDTTAAQAAITALEAELVREGEYVREVNGRIPTHAPAALPAYDAVGRVGYGPGQYRADDAATGRPTFLMDLVRAQVLRDPSAAQRLARHAEEVVRDASRGPVALRAAATMAQRDIGTGAVSGLVPPIYLTQQYAELARGGRPVADAVTRIPLPAEGMTVNISQVTTGTSVAAQTTENATVSETDLDDTLLTVNVRTIAGQQDVSRQAIERGALVEQVVFGDLMAAHDEQLESQVLAGAGTSGTHLGMLNVSGTTAITYTDASPTVAELFPKIADAVRQVGIIRKRRATHLIMSADTWGWVIAAVDATDGRPLFDVGGTGGVNVMGAGLAEPGGPAGRMLGCDVLVSSGMPNNLGAGTNESRIIAASLADAILWEIPGSPVMIRADQINASTLGIKLVVYSYSAFTAGRQPTGLAIIAGTGLAVPDTL